MLACLGRADASEIKRQQKRYEQIAHGLLTFLSAGFITYLLPLPG